MSLFILTVSADDDSDQQLQNRLRAHIEFLASDLMRGRQPGSNGYNIAADYVVSQYRQMGLLPAGDEESYFQQVPLRQALLVPGSAELTILNNGKSSQLVFVEQFFMRPSLVRTNTALEAGLVFVGYGIDAPELNHYDYAEIDAEGKIVVLFAGQPAGFPSEQGAHFASGNEKERAAVRNGAVGMIVIHTPRAAERSHWDRFKSRIGKPSMGWVNDKGEVHGKFRQIQAQGMISHTAAGVFFENAVVDLSTLIARDEAGEELVSVDLEGIVTMRQRSAHKDLYSPNVAAVLPGTDPLLADEYVLYTAHLDHLGELHPGGIEPGQQDLVNNGALDNASGVSVMLETARLFTEGTTPRRSILFVAVTAEEKGLVGSEYFAVNPTVPVKAIVSEINLDMPLLLYDFGDVIAFGAERSSLGDTVRRAAQSFGIALTPDPFPEQNIFIRSDHYRFVQQGIPSVFLVTGRRSLDGTVNTKEIFEAFLQKHYHKPSDDLNLPIHYGAAARFTRINAKIGEMISQEPSRPSWHEGDFFGRTYAQ